MKVSIIIPVYNAEKTIKKCINSILNQTYKNIEVIAVNDGSKDDSLSILNKIKDKRLKIISQENKGPSTARNNGLLNSTGEYIMFIDSDDYLDINAIEYMYKNLKYDYLIGILHKDVINGNVKIINYKEIYTSDDFIINILKNNVLGVIWGFIFKKDLINNLKFDENTFFLEDTLFLMNYLNKIKYVQFLNYENTFYNYVYNSNGITKNKGNALKKIKSINYSLTKIGDILGDKYSDLIIEKKVTLFEKELRNVNDTDEIKSFFKLLKDDKLYSKNIRNKIFCLLVNVRSKRLLFIYYRLREKIKEIKRR